MRDDLTQVPVIPASIAGNAKEGLTNGEGRVEPVRGTYLFSAVRNEAPFLIEWIAYHKVIGFENVLIFANPSTDGTDELLTALHDAGEITYVPHVPPEGVGAQPNAVRLVNEGNYIPDGAWTAWLDADEFLNIHHGDGHLGSLIDWMGDRVCILIQWRVFGDSGHSRFGGRFLSKDFVKAADPSNPVNHEIKSFFKKGNGILGFSSKNPHRPSISRDSELTFASVATGSGRQLAKNRLAKSWLSGRAYPNATSVEDRGFEIAQVNHYAVRTPEHFLLKRLRGRGFKSAAAGQVNGRHSLDYYRKFNCNEVEDCSILRWENACGQEIERLLAIPSVREAENAAKKRTSREIAHLPEQSLAELRTNQPQVTGIGAGHQSNSGAPQMQIAPEFRLSLPDLEGNALRQAYSSVGVVLEYGSGGSTFLALSSGAGFVMSVESDREWCTKIDAALAAEFPSDRFLVHHADIGPTLSWGRPAGPRGFRNFHLYPTAIWDHPRFRQPDVVLIDGRFRVACFLATMIRCTRPVTVLFDDYIDRDYYHWVEDLIPRDEMIGRMARFTVTPQTLPPEQLTRFAGAFTDPR